MAEAIITTSKAAFKDYLSLARIDHWFKNVFMLPGALFAIIYFNPTFSVGLLQNFIIGILSTCFVASANYVINEWIDARFDKFHPVKKQRTSVTKELRKSVVIAEYLIFAIVGLILAYVISIPFFSLRAVITFYGISV
jgi:decaprenyl-phosphate phosphoribosyltransferase